MRPNWARGKVYVHVNGSRGDNNNYLIDGISDPSGSRDARNLGGAQISPSMRPT
jgi:hypothetical protein